MRCAAENEAAHEPVLSLTSQSDSAAWSCRLAVVDIVAEPARGFRGPPGTWATLLPSWILADYGRAAPIGGEENRRSDRSSIALARAAARVVAGAASAALALFPGVALAGNMWR